MPHLHSSCRDRGAMFLKTELDSLYSRRLSIVSTIRELESWKRALLAAAKDSTGFRPRKRWQ